MKKFIFRFETVLGVKEKKEEQLKRELMKLIGMKIEQEKRLKMLQEKRVKASLDKTKEKEAGTDIEKLIQYEMHLNSIRHQIENTKIKIKEIEKLTDKKREEVVEASKERKIFEKLKERDFEEFMKNLNSHEQKQLDEIAISKYNRKEQHNY